MEKTIPEHVWKKQTLAAECATVQAPAYDHYADFRMEPSGHYVLIRIAPDENLIELAVVNSGHEIILIIRGDTPQAVYHQLFSREEAQGWFVSSEHVAYVGKELQRAYQALCQKEAYTQA